MAPRIAIAVGDVARSGDAWRITWRITGAGRVTHVAVPHGRFRADDRDVDLELPAALTIDVACREPAGAEIENAFLILRLRVGGESWRILARTRVRVDQDGVPRPAIERIDVQEVGFSGQG